MPTPVRLKLSAVEDLGEAYAWYEGQRPGLGEEFLEAVRRCLDSIALHPKVNAIVWKTCRSATARPFPYSVLYRIDPHEVVVRAILHHARDPKLWKRRLRDTGP